MNKTIIGNKTTLVLMLAIIVGLVFSLSGFVFAQDNGEPAGDPGVKKIRTVIKSKSKTGVSDKDQRFQVNATTVIIDNYKEQVSLDGMYVPCDAIIEYYPGVGRDSIAAKITITGIYASSTKKFEKELIPQ